MGQKTGKLTPRTRAGELVRRLPAIYPDAHCELNHGGPFQLLVATILSAQCTDKRVNMVTPDLFARYPDARALAAAPQEDVEAIIRTTGFFRSKAKNLIAMARDLVALHAGQVPASMDTLTRLPGVGRKTANVVLGNAFGIQEGIVVDTHVARLSRRLALTKQAEPEKIEADLTRLVPRDRWADWSHWLIFHGRRRCTARNPDCPACELRDLCPSATPARPS